MRRRKLADLGSGAGGSAWGYHLAGFDVTGVDIVPQPRFPVILPYVKFVQADAVEFLREHGHEFDAFACSPPCQPYSRMSGCRPGLASTYPELIVPWRDALLEQDKPFIMENVKGAPLRSPVMLCTAAFGRETYRHRFFESNIPLEVPPDPPHLVPASRAGHWEPGTYISIAGHFSPVSKGREAMGIEWMRREELKEAVPPCFTEFLGKQLLQWLDRSEQDTLQLVGN